RGEARGARTWRPLRRAPSITAARARRQRARGARDRLRGVGGRVAESGIPGSRHAGEAGAAGAAAAPGRSRPASRPSDPAGAFALLAEMTRDFAGCFDLAATLPRALAS